MKTLLLLGVAWMISLNVTAQKDFEQNWMKLMQAGQYESALVVLEDEAAIVRATIGEKGAKYLEILDKLSVNHYYCGNYAKAQYYILENIALHEQLKMTSDAEYVHQLGNALIILCATAEYDKAFVMCKKYEKVALKVFGSGTADYADAMMRCAIVFNDMGSSQNDEFLMNRCREYFAKARTAYSGKDKKTNAQEILLTMHESAFNNNTGNLPKAESLMITALEMTASEYGKEGPVYANMLNNMGVYYYANGNYVKAESSFSLAVKIYAESEAKSSFDHAVCLNNLSVLNQELGNYSKATTLLNEAEAMTSKNYVNHSPWQFVILNNRSTNIMLQEYFTEEEKKSKARFRNAGELITIADSLFMINTRIPHYSGLQLKMNFCFWLKFSGKPKEANNILTDLVMKSNIASFNTVSMVQKVVFPGILSWEGNKYLMNFPRPVPLTYQMNVPELMINEEALEANRKNQDAMISFMIRMFVGRGEKIKKALGPYHPGYASLLKGFTPLYESIGDYVYEEKMKIEYLGIVKHNTLQDFTFLSESEKELYLKMRLPEIDDFLSYSVRRYEKNQDIACHAYDLVLMYKGLMLKSSTAMRQAVQSSKDTSLMRRFDQWIELQRDISRLYATPVDLREQDVVVLESRAAALEKELVKGSQEFGDLRGSMNTVWTSVRDSLGENEAAIEFVSFRVKQKHTSAVTFYCAMVVKKGSLHPEIIQLCSENELLELLGVKARDDFGKIRMIYGSSENPDNQLYNMIWKPLEKSLQGVKKVYLSPAGLLNKVSFAALCRDKEVLLCDLFEIEMKGSTAKLNMKVSSGFSEDLTALVFGGIDYNSDSTDVSAWNYLEGTRDEALAVKQIFADNQVNATCLTAKGATETFMKQNAPNYGVLHISTHGFFFPDPNSTEMEEVEVIESGGITFRGSMRGLKVNNIVTNQNPLMRSGLVFAGANHSWTDAAPLSGDDGVLTALEVAQLNMSSTNLVVLSACETGLGDIRGNEGVYGLQRAFKMAGVHFIMMSLWQVPDKETVEFMETFYKHFLALRDVKKAFSQTQKEMRKKYEPFYWAAFVLIE